MRLTNKKELVCVNRQHRYDYRDNDKSLFDIIFPFPAPTFFYNYVLAESVLCADLTFPLLDKSHPTLKVYIVKSIYDMTTTVRAGHIQFPKKIYETPDHEFIPHVEIDKAIGMILGENRLNAYLTTYNRNGKVLETFEIPQPYVTMDMVDDAPVLTLTSL